MANKKTVEREIAWMKFLYESKSQTEIARELNVSLKSIGIWAREDNWEKKREMLKLTNEKIAMKNTEYLGNLFMLIDSRPEKERFPSTAEANIMIQMGTIKDKFKPELQLPQLYEAATKIMNYIKTRNLSLAKEITPYIDSLMKEEAEKYTQ
ncbi:MAG: hypothetical protein K1X92_08920 [Bacteroidia bacterium]|nr:hypothetical protein [Bacteroidia bacterium]